MTSRATLVAPAFDRPRLALALLATIVLGIVSRKAHLGFAAWDKWVGDALYAVAFYLVIALLFPRIRPLTLALVTFGICFAIELFQLTGIPLALAARWPLVAWFLGRAFGWEDVISYAVGVAAIGTLAPRVGLSGAKSTP